MYPNADIKGTIYKDISGKRIYVINNEIVKACYSDSGWKESYKLGKIKKPIRKSVTKNKDSEEEETW